MQSAYRMCHSTETALLKVQSDVLHAMHKKHMVALVLLDLSAAFDTIDHAILFSRLEHHFGIVDTALKWLKSYLSNRSQSVIISGNISTNIKLTFGVPQGSVIGPILFTMYTVPLGDIARKHNLDYHFYADDSQLYISFNPNTDTVNRLNQLEACIADIKRWMLVNFLKLNDDKTEVMLFGSPYFLKKQPSISVLVGETLINSSTHVRNLGAILDKGMTMEKFVNLKISSSSFYLKSIAKIRKFLTISAAKSLIHAYVISRLDYCNCLLLGAKKYLIRKLQNVQNTAARIVTCTTRQSDITGILNELHWLPIWKRIIFKILVHMYNCVKGCAPQYLKDCIPQY